MNIQQYFMAVKMLKIVFFFLLIFAQNIDCGYTLEPPQRGGSNEFPQYMFGAKIRKKYTPVNPRFTIQKWVVRGYSLHGLVFVMQAEDFCCKSSSGVHFETKYRND